MLCRMTRTPLLVRSVQIFCIVLLNLLLLSFMGCSSRGDDSGDDDSGDINAGDDDTGDDDTGDDDTGDDDTGDDDTGDDDDGGGDTLLTESECDRICSEREQAIDDSGHCDFEWNSGVCREVCADYAAFSTATEQVFIECVAADPLCFQDIHQCVLSGRYPNPVVAPFVLTATGFADYEAIPVVVALEAGGTDFALADPQTVVDGGFGAEWQESTYIGGGHMAMYYLDMDSNGDCDPAIDVTGSAQMVLGSDVDNPLFTADVVPPETAADFVCDFI